MLFSIENNQSLSDTKQDILVTLYNMVSFVNIS